MTRIAAQHAAAIAAPLLARLATQFTSYEYFWLYLMGLTCAAIVSQDSRLKGALALLIGLLFSTVGLGTDYARPRLTFDIDPLITGISFIPAMIGLFGLLPLVISPGAGSELYRGMGSVLLGGLVVSTVFTLILVPALFTLMLEARQALARLLFGRTPEPPAAKPAPEPEPAGALS